MDWDLLVGMTSATGVSVAAAAWLAKRLVDHRLTLERDRVTKALDQGQARFQQALEQEKTRFAGQVRQQVESALGERAAEREYQLEARKRLYAAVGPLKFQLLVACRDLAERVRGHGLRYAYATPIESYYGRSTVYRLLRPLAIGELIERQIAFADFAVDRGAVDLLRFRRAAAAALSGGELVRGHPGVDWSRQAQHVYAETLTRASSALVVEPAEGSPRVMRFDEFEHLVDTDEGIARLGPLPAIFADFDARSKPLFWLRLVGAATLANEFVNRVGEAAGFERRDFPVEDLVRAGGDPELLADVPGYAARCRALADRPL